jgi:hypothetical protein
VSPLWRDELGIYLAPLRVCAVRLKRGIKPVLSGEHEQAVENDDAGHWGPALAAADALLSQPQWGGALTRVVLADWWARYVIVPWVPDLVSLEERQAYARQLLASAYGEAVSTWDVQVSDAPPTMSRVACTLPAELTAAVRTLCTKHGTKLASLQPQLIAAYDTWRYKLPPVGAWFVSIGDGTLAAARMAAEGWDRVHSVRIGPEWTRELKRLQTFGRLASLNPEEGRVYVDAPYAWREVAGDAGRELHWLEDDERPLTTLTRLSRVRRLAA